MLEYQGCKFRPLETIVSYNEWGEKVEKTKFIPTKGYMKWLKEREEEKRQKEITILKHSLEYQMKTYGEVDKYDYQRYISMVQQSYNK